MKLNYKIFLTGLLALTACKPEVEITPAAAGSADFSTYIAIGDSQTAGYADNGLYRSGQINSFPNIIAEQLKAVGGGNFSQPLFNEAQADGSGYKKLTALVNGSPVLADVKATAERGGTTITGSPLYTKFVGDNNNYGIPALKVQQVTTPIVSLANPYFERLLTNSTPVSYLDFVTAKPYTFFTCWLGSNDALLYAAAGGVGETLTDKTQFAQLYAATINKLTAANQKGAVATVPDVSTIPYFNTVTIPALLAAVQRAAPTLTTLYINARTDAGTYAPRAATTADLVVLTFPTAKMGVNGYGVSPLNPIENQYVLDAGEVAMVKDYVAAYNKTITDIAAAKGLAVYDAYSFLNTIKQKGLLIDGVNLNTNYITGGIFSLDGVHLTPKGYAIEANEFIKAINTKYGSTIPTANTSGFNSVIFP
jgi:lysophospholipase L1-like esterase